jgi:hypothetical protein
MQAQQLSQTAVDKTQASSANLAPAQERAAVPEKQATAPRDTPREQVIQTMRQRKREQGIGR